MFALLVASTLSCLSPKASTTLEGGRHQRLETKAGPVHLWCANEKPEAVVIYVHGYFDDVDSAVRKHALVRQFNASQVPALFVMIEAPSSAKEPVRWPQFESLKNTLESQTGLALPERVVAIGHSGGNRTVRGWAQAGSVREVVLLDAFYGSGEPWSAFVGIEDAQLDVVSVLTAARAQAWLSTVPAAQRSRVRHVIAPTSHMGLVTDGEWIPRVLQRRFPRS